MKKLLVTLVALTSYSILGSGTQIEDTDKTLPFRLLLADPDFGRVAKQANKRIDAFQKTPTAPLFQAITDNNLAEVQEQVTELKKTNADILTTARNPIDLSPLAHAVTTGTDLKIIKYLVEQGAPTDFTHEHFTKNSDGTMQKFKGDTLLELLFSQGPVALQYDNPNITNDEIEDYLFEVAKFLMHNGAPYQTEKKVPIPNFNPSAFTEYDVVSVKSPFEALHTFDNTLSGNTFKKLQRLKLINQPLQDPSEYRKTPLGKAISDNDPVEVKKLLEEGADPNLLDWRENTPLHYALNKNSKEIIELLLEHGAHVNEVNGNSSLPVHYAVFQNDLDLVKLLVKHGADVCAAEPLGGNTALHFISRHFNTPSVDILNFLLAQGIDVNQLNTERQTPLHIAITSGAYNFVSWLLEHGAHVDQPNKNGETPLHLALRFNRDPNIARMLLARGADIHKVDNAGNTSVCFAAMNSFIDKNLLEELIAGDVDFNQPNNAGKAPLLFAAQLFNQTALDVLLRNGAYINQDH